MTERVNEGKNNVPAIEIKNKTTHLIQETDVFSQVQELGSYSNPQSGERGAVLWGTQTASPSGKLSTNSRELQPILIFF